MTVLVLGAAGQLATHLREHLPEASFRGRDALDLANAAKVPAAIEAIAPTVIVNAAAYTAVDKAEDERDLAWRINADAVAAVARTAAGLDIPLVHVSTDYVFDGRKHGAYLVDDPVWPLNVYGLTKLAGELAVRALCAKHWILRTSWVFSEHGSNFAKTMLRLARTQATLNVVADQRGRPTYAGDLARLIAAIVRPRRSAASLPYGVYHAVGGPAVSWHGFAEAVIAAAERHGRLATRPLVNPITTAEYPTAAHRPQNSVLEPSRELEASLGVVLDWTRCLDTVVQRIENRGAAREEIGRP